MNIFKLSLLLALMTGSILFFSCGQEAAQEGAATDQVEQAPSQEATPAAEQGPEFTSKYVCPMHCEGSGSADPGSCPVCGMEYVLNENHHEGHDHGDHEGHDHNGN